MEWFPKKGIFSFFDGVMFAKRLFGEKGYYRAAKIFEKNQLSDLTSIKKYTIMQTRLKNKNDLAVDPRYPGGGTQEKIYLSIYYHICFCFSTTDRIFFCSTKVYNISCPINRTKWRWGKIGRRQALDRTLAAGAARTAKKGP